MKLWNKFLNALYQVDKPISLATSNKIALLIVIVFMLLLAALQNFQATSNVFKDALRLLGFDSIADLSEYLTGGNYDEGQARELCKDVLDEGNLDDIDPETEHGDEMRDRLAGK